jgi:hypothetical protein
MIMYGIIFNTPSLNIVSVVISKRMRWSEHVRMWEIRNAYKILVGKPDEKRPLGRSRNRLEDNITVYIKRDVRVWTKLDWLRIGYTVGVPDKRNGIS